MIVCAVSSFAQLTGVDEIPTTVIHKLPVDNDHKLKNGTNFRDYGPTVIRGVGKFFGVKLNYDGSVNREADLRFALYDMNKEIVELYEPMRVQVLAGGINGFLIPCMVNAPAGDYYVVPLFRWAGESDWTATYSSIFNPANDLFDATLWQWKFKVIDDKLPLVKQIDVDDGSGYRPAEVYQGQKIDLPVKMRNPYSTTSRGKVRILHERNIKKFSPGYAYSDSDPAEEFRDVLTLFASLNGVKADTDGAFDIVLNPGEVKSFRFEDLISYDEHGYYQQFVGVVYCSFLPEGKANIEENWVMLQEDVSVLFDDSGLKYSTINEDYWTTASNAGNECHNITGFVLVPNPSAVPHIELSTVTASYDRSSKIFHLENIPETSYVQVVSIGSGNIVQSSYGNNNGVEVSFATLPRGVYVVSLFDYGGSLVKSFKILR